MTTTPPSLTPWGEISSDLIATITMASLQQYYKLPVLRQGTPSACPVCKLTRVYFGQGVCSACFKIGRDLIGRDLLDALQTRALNPVGRKSKHSSVVAPTIKSADQETTPEPPETKIIAPAAIVIPEKDIELERVHIDDGPSIKEAIVIDYGNNTLELRKTGNSVDLIITLDDELVWKINNIQGAALDKIKKFLVT